MTEARSSPHVPDQPPESLVPTPTLDKLGISLSQATKLVAQLADQLDVNTIRIRDTTNRIKRTTAESSRLTELVAREQTLINERISIVDQLNLLLKDAGQHVNDPIVAAARAENPTRGT